MTHRLLLVHAHPDDETIGTGITMAKYADQGVHVALVTCTLGEEGEVVVDDLSHLEATGGPELGHHRAQELADAMAALGVADFRQLGGPGRFRDSGMVGTEPNLRPDSFWQSDLLIAATELVSVIREVQPQVVVTYDDFGGYGHPDHIQAHRVTHYAVALAQSSSFRADLGPAWTVSKVYWTAMPRSIMRASILALREQDSSSPFAQMDPDDIPFACDDALITTMVSGPEYLPVKMAAMRAHATQISVDGGLFALADGVGAQAFSNEYFRLAQGSLGPDRDDLGLETDLFSGIAP